MQVAAPPLTQQDILTEFGDMFEGLGKLPGEYRIDVDPSVKPVQHHPRKVPEALKKDLKKEITRLGADESNDPDGLDQQCRGCPQGIWETTNMY